MNPDRPVQQRQQALTARLRCYYADPARRHQRPHCQTVAVVAYNTIALCATCDLMRSAVGKGTVARPLPGAELAELLDAAHQAADAARRLDTAVVAARRARASWAHIADAVGVTRQGAQQRWQATTADQPPPDPTSHGPI